VSPAHETEERCLALVLAAGAGVRLGRERPKAFVPLLGRPLLAWSVTALARHPLVTDLLVVVPAGWEERFRAEIVAPAADELRGAVRKIWGVVPGGARRQDSARLGLAAAGEILPEGARAEVLVHDAARPIVPQALVTRLVARLREARASGAGPTGVIPVVRVHETLKEVAWPAAGPARVTRTVPRDALWRAQTPQGFGLHALREAHEAAHAAGFAATDDAMLYEWRGWAVEAVAGATANLKVTDAMDLAWAAAWLSRAASEAEE
jgi:2-C-methyl-D-erythritol 4-phosphate cytidylyltransferase